MRIRMHARTCFYLIGSLVIVFGMLPICSAQHPSISVLQPQAIITSTRQIGQRLIHNYTFVITVRNTGDAPSDNITFSLIDPEVHSPLQIGNCTLLPGELKQFSKSNYPLAISTPFTLNITWAPTNQSGIHDQYNSGLQTFTIGGTTTTKKSTPGFECALAILALGITALVYRKKLK